MISTVLFDLDGVLVFSQDAWKSAYSSMYESNFTEELPWPLYETLKHKSNYDAIQALTSKFDTTQKRTMELVDLVEDLFTEEFIDLVKASPNALMVINELRERGYQLGIITNGSPIPVRKLVSRFLDPTCFEVIITPNAKLKPKPAPDMLLSAMGRLMVPKEQCLFIGDSCSDLIAAMQSDVRFMLASDIDCKLETVLTQKIADLSELLHILPDRKHG